jgi:hypothetical protein
LGGDNMKKYNLFILIFILTGILTSCETGTNNSVSQGLENEETLIEEINTLKDENTEIKSQLDTLQSSYDSLKTNQDNLKLVLDTLEDDIESLTNTINQLDFDEISAKISEINEIDLSDYSSLLDIENDITNLTTSISTINDSLDVLNQYDLSAIEDLTKSMETINTTIENINTTLSILSTDDDSSNDDLIDNLETILLEMNEKLNFLRRYDIRSYSLTDDTVQELIYDLYTNYNNTMPDDSFNPIESSVGNSCITITYETCQTKNDSPIIYTNSYNIMKNKIDYIKQNQIYIEKLNNFIITFSGKDLPVFPEELDKYDTGEIKYVSRTQYSSTYALQFFDTIDDDDYRFDTQIKVIMGDYIQVNVLMDIKIKTILGYKTESTKNFIFRYDDDKSTIYNTIQETTYPINKSVSFTKTNDIYRVTYYEYEELKSRLLLYTAFNEDYAYVVSDQDSYSDEVISYFNEEYYTPDGLFYKENVMSYFDLVPLKFFDNWKKVYYREDGELTKIRISKVILDDNSEIIVSDESLDYNDSKILRTDLHYYDSDGKFTELNDYLVYGLSSSSILSTSVTKSDKYNTYMSALNNLDLDDYIIESIDRRFDIFTYNYLEEIVNSKTKEEVYQDAIYLSEIAKEFCTTSYCYYSNYLDEFSVGFDEEYYNIDNTYVYYPNNYNRVYLYANLSGDYEFYGKNPDDYTKDDVTINP